MENLRGAALMTAAMAAFAIEDMLIKQLSASLPTGQIIAIIGTGAALFFAGYFLVRGERIWSPLYLHPHVLARSGLEIFGTLCFVTALALIPISTASAILQAVPLFVTLGGALFLGQPVGWRRWTAIVIGFLGMLLIVQPGLDGFEPAALFAVAAMVGLGARDLLTRALPVPVPGPRLSIHAFTALIPAGLALMWATGTPPVRPEGIDLVRMIACVGVAIVAYLTIVGATKIGDVAVISPFRYTRIVFALIVGFMVFGERPDTLMLTGVALIVGSGLYAFLRELQIARRAASTESANSL